MIEWSAELGSDITFFLSRGTAYCTGRGEIMTPIDPPLPSGAKLSIVKPDLGLSTPKVFQALDYDQLSTEDGETLRDIFLKNGVVDTAFYLIEDYPTVVSLPNYHNYGTTKDQLHTLKPELLSKLFSITITTEKTP